MLLEGNSVPSPEPPQASNSEVTQSKMQVFIILIRRISIVIVNRKPLSGCDPVGYSTVTTILLKANEIRITLF
jgi:ABC-type uncharacterized transport system ATPase subunit